MTSRSTRQNNTDEKLLVAIQRNNEDAFKVRNLPNNADYKLIKEKEEQSELAREKVERLKALRMGAKKVTKKRKTSRK